jgi:GT2 family glycosyltransferase
MDYDAMLTTPHWHDQLVDAFAANPQAGVIGAITNRIGSKHQKYSGIPWEEHSIKAHRRVGEELYRAHGSEVKDITNGPGDLLGGVLMAIPKHVWNRINFPETGKKLGVDNEFHRRLKKAGYKVLIATGLYVYHWYRA